MNQEDAMNLLHQFLLNPDHGHGAQYGYELYLPTLLRNHLEANGVQQGPDVEHRISQCIPALYSAAWEFCRRGIIRPGVKEFRGQATDDGNAGNGYSITPFGRQWLADEQQDIFVPTEPERFGQLLARFRESFGEGFHQRAQQAVRCYGAHAYLASCAMCGAAAESIMLKVAIEKTNAENKVLKIYSRARGRTNIQNIIIGKLNKPIQEQFKAFTGLLNYWRDETAHGKASEIDADEAFTSLALLLRFSLFVEDEWEDLTRNEE
ncbi:hypothetical protein [Pleionea sp. CnH1-48]|uniref:hypothetical protein n=1 Tax=Pleionea sp. CnH1-48 TaxID=2954494 RepID=UPI002097353F|nr:hypothetical protein [Pleionea sp. CnH1-48]MCO7225945.1 hypothetical protein [Pleionea sp. CnH1-48]